MILLPRLTWLLARDLIVVLWAGSMAVTQVIMLMIKIYLFDLNDDCLL